MENVTMPNPTLITRVRFVSPMTAARRLTVGVRGAFSAPTYKAPAAKDVAYLRSWRPPV